MIELEGSLSNMRQVDVTAIEGELETMWREANASVAASGGQAFSRNSVLTLVVFTHSEVKAQRVLTAVHALTAEHPSRVIAVVADGQQHGPAIQARIGTYSHNGTASYGEDIVLNAEPDAVQHMPGVVLPLVVSGLPSFLWWTGEPPWHTALLESLIDGCDRFVVDTAEMSHVEPSLGALADLMRRKKTRCAISDATWSCQTPWRELVAQFFDGVQLRQYLEGIERVTIEYAAGDEDAGANSGEAYLFAGWLASRLGWVGEHPGRHAVDSARHLTLRDVNGQRVEVEMTARFGVPLGSWWDQHGVGSNVTSGELRTGAQRLAAKPWVRNGALMSVHVASQVNGQRATFTVAREPDLEHATTHCHVPEGAPPFQTVHLQSIGEATPLAEQLQHLSHDAVYEDALAAAAQLLGPVARRGAI